ncbi:MAG: hypothetical protein AAFV37_11265, partial [Pseudomonadota bacterium]
FVHLPFEEACLQFYENDAPVATASATQVRKPIYAGAVNRWKKYRPAIDPALAILADANLIDDDFDAPYGLNGDHHFA